MSPKTPYTLAVALAATMGAAYADTPPATGERLEEVVVTAQRREQKLQDVPVRSRRSAKAPSTMPVSRTRPISWR